MRLSPHRTKFSFPFILKPCSSGVLTGEYFDVRLVVVVVVVAATAVLAMMVVVVDSGDNQSNEGEAKTILGS